MRALQHMTFSSYMYEMDDKDTKLVLVNYLERNKIFEIPVSDEITDVEFLEKTF